MRCASCICWRPRIDRIGSSITLVSFAAMTKTVDNLILELLEQIHGEQAAARNQQAEKMSRLGRIETMIGHLLNVGSNLKL